VTSEIYLKRDVTKFTYVTLRTVHGNMQR